MYRFLYFLIVAMDANFCLKNLMQSSNAKDPGLHMGMAYFQTDQPYCEHVLKYASQKDVSVSSPVRMTNLIHLWSAHAVVSRPWHTPKPNSWLGCTPPESAQPPTHSLHHSWVIQGVDAMFLGRLVILMRMIRGNTDNFKLLNHCATPGTKHL